VTDALHFTLTFYDLCTIILFNHFTTYGAARPANAPEMPIIRALPKENLPVSHNAPATASATMTTAKKSEIIFFSIYAF